MRIEFCKERIGNPRIRIMHAQTCFESLAAFPDRFEALACGLAVAVVPSQIAQRLLAFKDRSRSNLFLVAVGKRPRRHDIGIEARLVPLRLTRGC